MERDLLGPTMLITSALPSARSPITRRGFVSAAAVMLAGCSPAPTPRLRIGTLTFPGYEPLFLARSLGKLDGKRVHLIEFPSAAEALLAFKNEAIDGLTVTLDDVLRLAQGGHEPRIVLMLDYSNGADMVLAKQGIENLDALRGKRVGVETNTLGTFMLGRALESQGMKFADILPISLRADRLEGAFHRGEVDAVVTYEPFASRLIARGARSIFDSSAMKEEIADVLVFRRKVIDSQRENIKLTMAGWFEALNYIRDNPQDAATRMAPREALTTEQFSAALKLVHIYTREENNKLLGPADESLINKLRMLAAFMETQKMLPPGTDVSTLREPSFLQ